ncbi:hypothetical protein [Nocardiopsis sp. CC223A]|nr:hypothetical protein [Nocardiopsis sp. CC223A]
MIVPAKDPENYSFEELFAMYEGLGLNKAQAEAHADILKNPDPEGREVY